jgi:hypothetical protein
MARWIPVSEKRPEKDGSVLVFRGYDNPRIDVEYYLNDGPYHSGFFDDGEQDTNVTHWMPLPEPPSS